MNSRLGTQLSFKSIVGPSIAVAIACVSLGLNSAESYADEAVQKPTDGTNQVIGTPNSSDGNPKQASTTLIEGHAQMDDMSIEAGWKPAIPASLQKTPLQGRIGKDEVRKKHKLTAEDYREMNYGVLGIITNRFIFSRYPTVSMVLSGCPAELAGIKAGDTEMQVGSHSMDEKLNQKDVWKYCDGKAGSPVDVVVRRKSQIITYHLIRMNIEDVPNKTVRKMFEKMLRDLGPPSGDVE